MYVSSLVSKVLRPHVRYAADLTGSRPATNVFGHLIEYLVRLALREHWDITDTSLSTDRILHLMFAQHR